MSPTSPAGLVSAAPNHEIGDIVTFSNAEQARILGVQRDGLAEELVQQGFVGVLTVEPLDPSLE